MTCYNHAGFNSSAVGVDGAQGKPQRAQPSSEGRTQGWQQALQWMGAAVSSFGTLSSRTGPLLHKGQHTHFRAIHSLTAPGEGRMGGPGPYFNLVITEHRKEN